MNELRMYVENLFTGKVLTPATIELKEEVYGNLVARYEDYRSNGLSEAEAIERTKASLTSIDDLIDGDDSEEASLQSEAAPALGDGADSAQPGRPASPVQESDVPRGAESALANGLASEPAARAESAARRKKWPFAVGAAIVILLVGLAAIGLLGGLFVVDEVFDRGLVSGQDPDSLANGLGVSGKNGDDAITVGSDGTVRFDGDLADDIVKAVVDAGPESISGYSGTSSNDEMAVRALAGALPMSTWMTEARGSAPAGDQLVLTYTGVPENYDSDSIDVAMAYNASAILIAMPTQGSVQVRVSESDDPNDYDAYTFTRESLERQFGFSLSSDLLTVDGWKKLKEGGIYQSGFAERAAEAAEDGVL